MSIRNFSNFKNPKFTNKNFETKISIIVVIVFFSITSYVAFIVDNPTQNHTLLFYYYAGKQTLYGDREDVYLHTAPVGWPIVLAFTDNLFNDAFITAKLISVFFATGIVFLSFYIIKNIFDKQLALLVQTLIAISPYLHQDAIIRIHEMLPVFLIFASFYFITKKQLSNRDVVLCGIFLGLSYMLRYQALFIGIGYVIFFLIQYKKIRLSKTILFLIFFIIAISPLLFYNLLTFGTLIESDPSYFLLHNSKFQDPEWKNTFVARTKSIDAGFLEINDILIKNYFYNLFYNNPDRIFNFSDGIDNFAPIPFIPYIGIFIILGGAALTFKRKIEKKEILFLSAISFIILIFLLITDNTQYFFISIIIPFLILGIRSIKEIERNVLPLLIASVCFFVMASIGKIHHPSDFFAILLIPYALTGLFILKGIPKIIQFIKLPSTKPVWTKTIIIFIIAIFIISNLIFSYELQAMFLFNDNFDWKDIFRDVVYGHDYGVPTAVTLKEIGDMLSKEPDITNKYIMSPDINIAHYANSKFVYASFTEGLPDSTITDYITRQGWSDFDIALSNMDSVPKDRHNKYKPVPDYLVYVSSEHNLDYLKILSDSTHPQIPKNFELIYKNEKSGIFVYKIKHE